MQIADRTAAEVTDPAGEFRRLAQQQLPRLYSIARRLVGEEAEDAVQDALLKAFQRFEQLDDPVAAPVWLTAILVNCCRDRGRSETRRPDEINFEEVEEFSLYRKIAYEDPFPYSDSLHLDFMGEFGTEDVRAVLARLPELYRVPLVPRLHVRENPYPFISERARDASAKYGVKSVSLRARKG